MDGPRSEVEAARKPLRRALFLAGLLLIGQGVFPKRHGEPYPAIKMPTFHASGGFRASGEVKATRAQVQFFDAEGQKSRTIEIHELLGRYPGSHRARIASYALTPKALEAIAEGGDRQSSAATPGWLSLLAPGHSTARRLQGGRVANASLQAFLRAEAAFLLPGFSAVSARFSWTTEVYRPESKGEVQSSQESRVVLVPLLGGESK